MQQVFITTPYIKLDSFLKLCGAFATGGQAKEAVLAGQILVDGEVCTMRGKKLTPGMVVEAEGSRYEVQAACG